MISIRDVFGRLGSASFSELVTIAVAGLAIITAINVLLQLLPQKKSEPPLVFHWSPLIGSTVTYGKDPPQFLIECRKKVGRQVWHLCWLC